MTAEEYQTIVKLVHNGEICIWVPQTKTLHEARRVCLNGTAVQIEVAPEGTNDNG